MELDVVLRGIRGGPAEGTQEIWIKAGDGRTLVVEDGHTVRDDTVSLSKSRRMGPVVASIVTGVPGKFRRGSLVGLDAGDGGRGVAGEHVDGRGCREGRGRKRLKNEDTEKRGAEHYEAGEDG